MDDLNKRIDYVKIKESIKCKPGDAAGSGLSPTPWSNSISWGDCFHLWSQNRSTQGSFLLAKAPKCRHLASCLLCPSSTSRAPVSSERGMRGPSFPSLLARGIVVISFMWNNMGGEAAYGFFHLGGLYMVWGSASYLVGLPVPQVPVQLWLGRAAPRKGSGLAAGLLWACSVGFYMGQLELDVNWVSEDEGMATVKSPDGAAPPLCEWAVRA